MRPAWLIHEIRRAVSLKCGQSQIGTLITFRLIDKPTESRLLLIPFLSSADSPLWSELLHRPELDGETRFPQLIYTNQRALQKIGSPAGRSFESRMWPQEGWEIALSSHEEG